MARMTRLELATSGVTGQRSNQLSYTRVRYFDKIKQFIHPVNKVMVGGEGFEPPTFTV